MRLGWALLVLNTNKNRSGTSGLVRVYGCKQPFSNIFS